MTSTPAAARYAIYYAPAAGSPWWRFGCEWLGRDAATGADEAQPDVRWLTAVDVARITNHPRRYGFHATLKAPFRLGDAASLDLLLARVQSLAATLAPLPLGMLVPVLMDGFVALVPARLNGALGALAQACVTQLDDLRAPLSPADLARREAPQLDPRGRELLECFGYPHVAERFRFHLSLTGPVDTATAGRVVGHVAHTVARLNLQAAPVLDRLCVFVQAGPDQPFQRLADFILGTK